MGEYNKNLQRSGIAAGPELKIRSFIFFMTSSKKRQRMTAGQSSDHLWCVC